MLNTVFKNVLKLKNANWFYILTSCTLVYAITFLTTELIPHAWGDSPSDIRELNLNTQHITYSNGPIKTRRWILFDENQISITLRVIDSAESFRGKMITDLSRITQALSFKKTYSKQSTEELAQLKADQTYFETLQDTLTTTPSLAPLVVRPYDLVSNDIKKDDPDARPLWVATKSAWEDSDRQAFSDFIQNEYNVDFFKNSDVLVDCADTAVAALWIFAYKNQLPVANTLPGSGKLFGHYTRNLAWDRLKSSPDRNWKEDERFKAALRYLLDQVYTHSIVSDLYPVALTPESIQPGTIHLYLHSLNSGHTETIKKIGITPGICPNSPCISSIWGNEPSRDVIFLSGLLNYDFKKKGKDGFLKWKTPVKQSNGNWSFLPSEKYPFYSTEQYQYINLTQMDVFERLGLQTTGDTFFYTNVANLTVAIQLRQQVVEKALTLCSPGVCPVGSSLYDQYSTPTRDQRMRDTALAVQQIINSESNPQLKDFYIDYLRSKPALSETAQVPFFRRGKADSTSINFQIFNLFDFVFNTDWTQTFSNNPNDPLSERWGFNHYHEVTDYPYAIMATYLFYLRKLTFDRALLISNKTQNFCKNHTSVCQPNNSTFYQTLNSVGIDYFLSDIISNLQNFNLDHHDFIASQLQDDNMFTRFTQCNSYKIDNELFAGAETYICADTDTRSLLNFNYYEAIFEKKFFDHLSPNPWDSFEKRWGMVP